MTTETPTPARWTTCTCPNEDGPHDPALVGHSTFHAESDAAMVARIIGGRHVVPVSEIRTEVPA